MPRPELDTLRLLRVVIDDIVTSPALAEGGSLFGITWNSVPDETWSAKEPGRRELRDLLDRVRQLDMPTSDVRLDRVYPMLEARALPDWQEELAKARDAYADWQETADGIQVQREDDPPIEEGEDREPVWIKPPEAFRLWAYGGVIHDDYPKEQRWLRLGPGRQAPLRLMAHDYTMMLISQADFLGQMLRHGLSVSLDDVD